MKNMLPYFTIIIPTYNVESHLKDAIDSILKQEYQNWEIVIQDGGSTDKTLDIISKIKDSRIKFISTSDKGIYDAMNKGIARARGKYIYFMGADDILFDKHVLKDIFYLSNKRNLLSIYGNVIFKSTNSVFGGYFNFDKLSRTNLSHQSIFYHRKIFTKLGLFNLKYPVYADAEFNLRLFSQIFIKRIKHTNRIIAIFNDSGISSSYNEDLFDQKKSHNIYLKKQSLINRIFSYFERRLYNTYDDE